jgi:hypothetical protein
VSLPTPDTSRGTTTGDAERLEDAILRRIVRLNATLSGVTGGLVLGFAIFLATNWLVLKGGPVVGPHLALLGQFFIGYRVTFAGSFIGLAYGFAAGFLIGYFMASIYNLVASRRERS